MVCCLYSQQHPLTPRHDHEPRAAVGLQKSPAQCTILTTITHFSTQWRKQRVGLDECISLRLVPLGEYDLETAESYCAEMCWSAVGMFEDSNSNCIIAVFRMLRDAQTAYQRQASLSAEMKLFTVEWDPGNIVHSTTVNYTIENTVKYSALFVFNLPEVDDMDLLLLQRFLEPNATEDTEEGRERVQDYDVIGTEMETCWNTELNADILYGVVTFQSPTDLGRALLEMHGRKLMGMSSGSLLPLRVMAQAHSK